MADPMYRQIAEDLRDRIESGQFASGGQLPSEIELRERYAASRNTIRDAIKRLTNLGLVETRPGQGTFVTENIDPLVTTLSGDREDGPGGGEGSSYMSEASRQNRKPTISSVQVEIQQASAGVSDALRIPPGSEVISRHQRRYVDDAPWSLQTSFYPGEFADRGADLLRKAGNIEEGTVQYLAGTLGIHQVGYRDWLTVRAPHATEADFFRLPADGRVSVIEVSRTAFDTAGHPIRVTVTVCPADRNQFVFNVGQVPDQETGGETQE